MQLCCIVNVNAVVFFHFIPCMHVHLILVAVSSRCPCTGICFFLIKRISAWSFLLLAATVSFWWLMSCITNHEPSISSHYVSTVNLKENASKAHVQLCLTNQSWSMKIFSHADIHLRDDDELSAHSSVASSFNKRFQAKNSFYMSLTVYALITKMRSHQE